MVKKLERQKTIVDDAKIIDFYWKRSEMAIQLTKDKYGSFLYRIAYNILHDNLDCEECQNDTYLGIWNAIPPEKPNVFSVFIARIMRNIACNKYKERSRKRRIPSEMTVSMAELEAVLCGNENPEEQCSAKELGKAINDYMGTLTDRRQYIFIGRFYMGDKLETIADELKINASTVHREIEKIKKGLKMYLEKEDIYV